jgi:activator of 2-hydroxyglutaryl-CoA dehydratase
MARRYAGIDVGTEYTHAVVLEDDKIVYAPQSIMHFGSPVNAIRQLHREISGKYGGVIIGFTGGGGKIIAEAVGSPFLHEPRAITLGVDFLNPDVNTVVHIGSRDSYLIRVGRVNVGEQRRVFTEDARTNTTCGGGSGWFLTKQARRIFENKVNGTDEQRRIEEMLRLAIEYAGKATVIEDSVARCGVVKQTDAINDQNRGKRVEDILMGLYRGCGLNFVGDVVGLTPVDRSRPVIGSGGVLLNMHVRNTLEELLGAKILVGEHVQRTGAIGAALNARGEIASARTFAETDLDRALERERGRIVYTDPLSSASHLVIDQKEEPLRKDGNVLLYREWAGRVPVTVGLDGGSTTTKAAIMSCDGRLDVLATICLETHSRPVETAQQLFGELRRVVGEKIDVRAVGYTGSSGGFYYKLFTRTDLSRKLIADGYWDEITTHAAGVNRFHPGIDTVFEIGGQDAKYILFDKKGVVQNARLNKSCMGGTGQNTQNLIFSMGLDHETANRLALSAKRTPIIDGTCGVFIEAGMSWLGSLGVPLDERMAALMNATTGGYLANVVAGEHTGDYISCQGGTMNSLAILHAFALQTGKVMRGLPYRQYFGAIGAGILAYNNLRNGEAND